MGKKLIGGGMMLAICGTLLCGCSSVDVGIRRDVASNENLLVGASYIGSSNMLCGIRCNLFNSSDQWRIYGLETGPGCDSEANGLQIAALSCENQNGNSLQIACNNQASDSNVWQIGLDNTCKNDFAFQIGGWNRADNTGILQIGLVNTSNYGNGLQIGLMNQTPNSWVSFMPFINVCISDPPPESEITTEIIKAEMAEANKALKTQAKLNAKAAKYKAKAAQYKAKVAAIEAQAAAIEAQATALEDLADAVDDLDDIE